MDLETWAAFAVASWALLTIPGPTVMLVVSYALGRGRGTALATVPGVALGDLTAMTVSLAGAGAVLAASAELFTLLKLAGAAYLVWLGVTMWRERPDRLAAPAAREGRHMSTMFRRSWLVTALNPKSIVFFVAFVPQFVVTESAYLPQAAVLVATFVSLAAINTALWALAAGTMRARFESPSTLRVLNRLGGSVLIGAGVLTAFARRQA